MTGNTATTETKDVGVLFDPNSSKQIFFTNDEFHNTQYFERGNVSWNHVSLEGHF